MAVSSLSRWFQRMRRRAKRLLHEGTAPRRPGFRTTAEGKVFIIVTFLIGFAAYNTATNLLYLIFSMMLSLIIVSATLSRSTIQGVTAERFVPTHLIAGEEALVHLTVRNGKRLLPSFSLRVADVLASNKILGQAYAVRVPPRGTARMAYRVRFEHRGMWELSRLVIATRYPFGFIEKSLSLATRQEVLVYPPVVELGPELAQAQRDLGEIETGRRGIGTSLHGLRQYTSGDPARLIHWKVSAKAREVVVREFEREEKKRVTLVLDNAAPPETADAFEWAVVFTASMAKALIDRDYQVQLLTRQGRVPFGTGGPHLSRLLRSLAIVALQPEAKEALWPHATRSGEATTLAVRFHGEALASGAYDQVFDTTHWRPERVPVPELARVA